MKKLFLILAAAVFMIACTPKNQPVVVDTPVEEDIVAVDETTDEVVADQPDTPASDKPVVKPKTPKAEEPKKEEPKAEEPKKEEPKAEEPQKPVNKGKGGR